MTTWFERRAGSDESLLALYEAVGAAEELDLSEQAHDEARWSEFWRLDAEGFVAWRTWDELVTGSDPVDEHDSLEHDEDETAERPSMSQAIGIIEHLLGGHRLP